MSEICFKITRRIRVGVKYTATGRGGDRRDTIGPELVIVEDKRCLQEFWVYCRTFSTSLG